jgi:hypothetical protein
MDDVKETEMRNAVNAKPSTSKQLPITHHPFKYVRKICNECLAERAHPHKKT